MPLFFFFFSLLFEVSSMPRGQSRKLLGKQLRHCKVSDMKVPLNCFETIPLHRHSGKGEWCGIPIILEFRETFHDEEQDCHNTHVNARSY